MAEEDEDREEDQRKNPWVCRCRVGIHFSQGDRGRNTSAWTTAQYQWKDSSQGFRAPRRSMAGRGRFTEFEISDDMRAVLLEEVHPFRHPRPVTLGIQRVVLIHESLAGARRL